MKASEGILLALAILATIVIFLLIGNVNQLEEKNHQLQQEVTVLKVNLTKEALKDHSNDELLIEL